jgi:hypothetical protein
VAITGFSLDLNGPLAVHHTDGGNFTLNSTNLLVPIGISLGPNFGSVSVTGENNDFTVETLSIGPVHSGQCVRQVR